MKEIFDFYRIEVDQKLIEKLHHRLSRYVCVNPPIDGKGEVKKFYELLSHDPHILDIKIKTLHGTFRFHQFGEILGIFDNAIEDIRSKYVVIPPFRQDKNGQTIAPKATKIKKKLTLSKEHDFKQRVERVKGILSRGIGIKKNRKLHPIVYDLMAKYWPVHFKEIGSPKDLQEDINNRKTSFINSLLKQKITSS